ncbi:MAG: 3-deoxy-7-phosphoheptulonate synthase [Lachnospiraceae bacterium]|nr:3-deoxy-7-phosphoheptulonate synthase [Lachnospiraceae bacterium]
MSFEYINQMPTPAETRQQFALSSALRAKKAENDEAVRRIIDGRDDRFLVIIGPCSADRTDSVLDYVSRLAEVNERVSRKLMIVPRVYTSKPRTTGSGYKGLLHQPNPQKISDMYEGVLAVRHLHMRVMKETGMSTADEMLYPELYEYTSDLVSYMAIGARSVENQQHRLMASGLDITVGMKNPTSGELSVMMNSIKAGQNSHHFALRGWEVMSEGNPWSHAILRGSVDSAGNSVPNYHYEDLRKLYELYAKDDLVNPAVIVDANHANSGKRYEEQIRIVNEVLHSRRYSEDIGRLVKGVMIESYLVDGCQKQTGSVYGQSITDPCLGWKKTERLLFEMAEQL